MATNNTSSKLNQYSLELVTQVSYESHIHTEHQFLSHREEAEMEQVALFGDEENIRIINSLYSKTGYEPTEADLLHVGVVASIGTSSTQVYTKEYVIGGFLTGSTAMHENPHIAGEVLRQIGKVMKNRGIDVPILLVNSIGFTVKTSVAINNMTETMLPLVINDEKYQKAHLAGDHSAAEKEKKEVECGSRILLELAKVSHELGLTKPCIVQSREKPKLKGDWLGVLCNTVCEQHPQGVYIVDFGGGGPDLNFFKPGPGGGLSSVDKDRSLRKGQPAFVNEMLRGEFATSDAFRSLVKFLREKITAHAATHGISPMVCKIYQTGMARQQHFLGHMNPVTDMAVFELDVDLNGYRNKLKDDLLAFGIDVDHQFLSQQDEAEMEQKALFENAENIEILRNLFEKVGHQPQPQEAEHVAVVASVGTSSTQVYSKKSVIGAFLTGSTAMHEDAAVAGQVLRAIALEVKKRGIDAPIVLVNSIGFLVKKSAKVNHRTHLTEAQLDIVINDTKLQEAIHAGDTGTEEKEAREVDSGKKILRELSRVSQELGLTQPCIVQSREKPKLKGDWLGVLSKTVGEQHPQGVYIVDFGGGGPDLNFYQPGAGPGGGLSSVGKDRSLRKGQPAFVNEMMHCRYITSEAYRSTVAFLREKIHNHSFEQRMASHSLHQVVCKVYQTGMARQQHFLGHINPVTDITIFPEPPEVTKAPETRPSAPGATERYDSSPFAPSPTPESNEAFCPGRCILC